MIIIHPHHVYHSLNKKDHVELVVGAPFPELKRWLGRASVGLHTMWNEHFGICIVEYMVCAGFTRARLAAQQK